MKDRLLSYWGLSLLVLPAFNSIYFLLNHAGDRVYNLVTAFDQMIPFIKYFALPYMAWYPFVMITLLWLMKLQPRLYATTLVTCILGLILSYIIFMFAQTTTPRPPIDGQDIFTQMVLFIYRADKPYNSFPSIHVLICFVLYQACTKLDIQAPLFVVSVRVSSMLIIISTLFIKQHTIVDVAGGIILGTLLFWLVDLLISKISKIAPLPEMN